jgi:hypothetical protein
LTDGDAHNRFSLPVPAAVHIPIRPSPTATVHTGVATPVPFRPAPHRRAERLYHVSALA